MRANLLITGLATVFGTAALAVEEPNAPAPEPVEHPDAQAPGEVSSFQFSQADEDGDGALDMQEAAAFGLSDQAFFEADRNFDGELIKEELEINRDGTVPGAADRVVGEPADERAGIVPGVADHDAD